MPLLPATIIGIIVAGEWMSVFFLPQLLFWGLAIGFWFGVALIIVETLRLVLP